MKLDLREARAERMRLQTPAEQQLHRDPNTRAAQLLLVPFALALLAVQLAKGLACTHVRVAVDAWEVLSNSTEPKSQRGRPADFAGQFVRKHIVREIDGRLVCGHENCIVARNRRMPCGHLLGLTGEAHPHSVRRSVFVSRIFVCQRLTSCRFALRRQRPVS